MKKFIKGIFAGFCALCFSLVLVGCGDENQKPIDNSCYFEEEVNYTVYPKTSVTTGSLADLLAEDVSMAYTSITLKGKKKWLAYMMVERVVYTFVANKDCALDLTFTIMHIDGEGENFKFDSKNDKYYYTDKGTLELYKDTPFSIEFYVGGSMQDKEGITFGLDIDKTIYIEEEGVDPKMSIKLQKIEVYGEHK